MRALSRRLGNALKRLGHVLGRFRATRHLHQRDVKFIGQLFSPLRAETRRPRLYLNF